MGQLVSRLFIHTPIILKKRAALLYVADDFRCLIQIFFIFVQVRLSTLRD